MSEREEEERNYVSVRNTMRFQWVSYCSRNNLREYSLRMVEQWRAEGLSPDEKEAECGRILEGLKNGTIRPEEDIEEDDEEDYSEEDDEEEDEYNEEKE